MSFDPETNHAVDWRHFDRVKDATFAPGDAHGDDATTFPVKVRWQGGEAQSQYRGGRLPMSPSESSLTFWKGDSTTAPDPRVDEAITVESVEYRITRVVDHRNGQFTLAVNEGRVNRP